MLSFISTAATTLVLLTNYSERFLLTPTVSLSTAPNSQTIINPAASFPMQGVENPKEGSLHPMAYPSLIDGLTDYNSTFRSESLLADMPKNVELGHLVKEGQSMRMIALGGSLTAGVRNGGLYREGQLTAYPNLIARQMGLVDFNSPTFSAGEANGTGFLTYSDPTATYPRWQQVANQLAPVQASYPPMLSMYTGKVDNYAVPTMQGSSFTMTWNPNATGVSNSGKKWFEFQPYLWRFFSLEENKKAGLLDYVSQTQSFNLFILEDKLEEWIRVVKQNDFLNSTRFTWDFTVGQFNYEAMAKKLIEGGRHGIVFTIPNFQDYAFMQWYPTEDLKRKAASIAIVYRDQRYFEKETKLDPATNFYMMPTVNVAKLYANLKKGDAVNITLTDADVMDEVEVRNSSPSFYNEHIRGMAQKFNLALVDLNVIYSEIHQGAYFAEGGLKIDGSPKGNFFSSDGTYPTAIGQVVIANEVIKALNAKYQSRIPLININDFIRRSGAK